MSKLCSASNLLPVGLVVMLCMLLYVGATHALRYDELVTLAHRLESSENLINKVDEKLARQHQNLLYLFTKETKSAQCSNYFKQAKEKINQFHVKAQQFMLESRAGNKGWFSGLFGPLNALKGVAKFEPTLEKLVDRYQSNPKLLTEQVLACDLTKFLMRALDNILFVYKTDIKALVTGERAVVNKAILDQLNKDNLVSRVNFYDFEKPTKRQQKVLLEYLGSVSDPSSVKVGDALNHYLSPGQFILGRIMDTCMYVLKFNDNWLETSSKAQCSGSRVPGASSRLSSGIDSSSKYEHLTDFCHEMLNLDNDDS